MNINYHAGCHKLREAYFKWRNSTKYIKQHSVVSFTAGYNAALADIKENARLKTELLPCGKDGTGFPV